MHKLGTRERKSKLFMQTGTFVSVNGKKITKKQEAEKEAAKKRRGKRYSTHRENNDKDQSPSLHLLSKTRQKKTDCDSKMAIRIYTNKKLANLCKIELWWNHNQVWTVSI